MSLRRLRTVDAQADRAAGAVEGLRICYNKLARRAEKLDSEVAARYAEAARLLGCALGEIDNASALVRMKAPRVRLTPLVDPEGGR